MKAPLPYGVSIIPFRWDSTRSFRRDGYARAELLVSQRLNPLDVTPGLWQFPGGGIEAGELPIHAAARELREETGLDVPLKYLDPLGHACGLIGYRGNKYDGFRYGAVVDAGQEVQHLEQEKHTAWQWLTAPAALELPMLEGVKSFAIEFMERLFTDRCLWNIRNRY